MLQLIVGVDGKPAQVRLLRKVGFGLDEKAIQAVGKWRFKPGTLNGVPVPVFATVEVNFNLLGLAPRYVQVFREARAHLESANSLEQKEGLKSIEDLVSRRFAPAMYLRAVIYRVGKLVPRDAERAERFMQEAADADSDQALYYVANQLETGEGRERDLNSARDYFLRCARMGQAPCSFRLARLDGDAIRLRRGITCPRLVRVGSGRGHRGGQAQGG